MNVKIISEISGEMQFDMSAENFIQLIGAATRYAADIPANHAAVTAAYDEAMKGIKEYAKQPEKKLEKPVSKVERMFGDYKSRIPIPSVIPAVRKAQPEGSYKGFLLIQCDDCGKVRGFYAKNPQSVYYCDCGCQTKLECLRPMFPKCIKCGNTFKYMTNIERSTLTYNCLNCGSPVDLTLNKSGEAFVTVGR